ncbi:MAG: hypothetical protein IJM25_04070 [Eubacterium sp.]|nr:hypothetical protein [Eubacterium sp.]
MKIYEIINEEDLLSVGVLLYYEKEHTFLIELSASLDEWTAPILFSRYVREGIYSIPRDISRLWVMARVVPSDRQNIDAILRNHKLGSYDEMKILEIAEGRCSQDSLAIRRLSELPDYVTERMKKNVVECFITEDEALLIFFADETIRKVKRSELSKFDSIEGMDAVLTNDSLYRSCKIGTGGYFVTFNDSIDLPATGLYATGEQIPLRRSDFVSFVKRNTLDTSESCSLLGCSRQNIAYMVKQNQLTPLREDVKGTLYSKGDVIKNTW